MFFISNTFNKILATFIRNVTLKTVCTFGHVQFDIFRYEVGPSVQKCNIYEYFFGNVSSLHMISGG